MAQIPTAEDSGGRILAIYRSDGTRTDQLIPVQSLMARFIDGRWQGSDLTSGLEWCVGQDFLEERKRNMFVLTASGFAAL